MYKEIHSKETLILGCGNVLFGDDAFGPAVIAKLVASNELPDHAHAEDVGTSIRDVLFNVALAEPRPKHVIVVDAVEVGGRTPGEVFELELADMPKVKMPDFSYHQFPTTNLLREMRYDAGIDVVIVAAQAETIPDHVVEGMSAAMTRAVDEAVRLILARCRPAA